MSISAKFVNSVLMGLLAIVACTTVGIALFSFSHQPADPTTSKNPVKDYRGATVSTNAPAQSNSASEDISPNGLPATGHPLPDRLSSESSKHMAHQLTNDTYRLRINTDRVNKNDRLNAGVVLENVQRRKVSGYEIGSQEDSFLNSEEDDRLKLELKKKL